MAFEHSALIDHPVDNVFAWFGRPGAIRRLVPPWQPVRVAAESPSLREGAAVLALPLGLKWIAEHQPAGFEEGRQFVDVLTTPGLASVLSWKHTHSFSPSGAEGTLVGDVVDTRLPGRMLEEMFGYRTRQLVGDLDSHALVNPAGRTSTVAVTGASGLIGSALCALLSTGGHRVVRLQRGSAASPGWRAWDPAAPAGDLLDGVDALVHLAGAPIAGRFTSRHKQEVRDSRIGPTRRLAELAGRVGVPVFVSASAVGFYGPDRGDEELTEDSEQGDGFLAQLVADWEAATSPADAGGGRRVVQVRTGIVQSPRGGALRLQRRLFETGLGGRLGDGRQWVPWIGIDDMVDVYLRALFDPSLSGPVNAAAPGAVRNSDFTQTLAHVLRRPAVLPVPRFGPALLFGREGATEFVAAGQRVVPAKLQAAGHRFRWPELEPGLRHVLGRMRQA